MRRPKTGVSLEEARDVAALDDLALSLVQRVFVPDGNAGPRILPEHALPPIDLTNTSVNNGASFRSVLEGLFDSYLAQRAATVPEAIMTWLLDTWTRTVFGGQLFVKADANGVPALHARTEIRPLTNLAGVEDLLIDLRGEENYEAMGMDDFFANWGKKRVEMWLGPMRLVNVSCAASSNAEFRNKPASHATKKLAIAVPQLDGVGVQRLETLKKTIDADQPIRVHYGESYDNVCTCHRHLKFSASQPPPASTPARKQRKVASKEASTPPRPRPPRAAKANARVVQPIVFEGESEQEMIVVDDDGDDSGADYRPEDEDMGDAEAASDELERVIKSATPGPSRRRQHESDSEGEFNPAPLKRRRLSKRRAIPASPSSPAAVVSPESDGLGALDSSPSSQAGGSRLPFARDSEDEGAAGPSRREAPPSPTQRAPQPHSKVAQWSAQVIPSPPRSQANGGPPPGPVTPRSSKGKDRAVPPPSSPPSFSPPSPDTGVAMDDTFSPPSALGLTSTPVATNPRTVAPGQVTLQVRPPISRLQVGPQVVGSPARGPPPPGPRPTVPRAEPASSLAIRPQGGSGRPAPLSGAHPPPDETLHKLDETLEQLNSIRAEVAKGAAVESELRAAREEFDRTRHHYEHRLEVLQTELDKTKVALASLQAMSEVTKNSEKTIAALRAEVKTLKEHIAALEQERKQAKATIKQITADRDKQLQLPQARIDHLKIELAAALDACSSKDKQLKLAHEHIAELRAEAEARNTSLKQANQLIGQLKTDAAAKGLPLRHLDRNGTGEGSSSAASATPPARRANHPQTTAESSARGPAPQRTAPLPTPEPSRSSIPPPGARTPTAPPRPPAKKPVGARFWAAK